MIKRALAGEFRFQEDRHGMPARVAELEVAALRAATIAAERAKPPPKARPKTPKQQEVQWARIAAANERVRRDGPFLDLHLRLTVPDESELKPKK